MGQLSRPTDTPDAGELNAVVDAYRAGRIDEALARAAALTESYPQHPFAFRALGSMLRERGATAAAIVPLRRAAQLADLAETHNDLGLVLQEAGELAEAEIELRRAVERRPDLVEAHANLGRLYQSVGRLGEAEASLRRALALNPDLAEAHNSLAVVLQESRRLAQAEASARRALVLRADYVEAHLVLGAILSESGRLAEAEQHFRAALQLQPDDLRAFSNLLFNHTYGAQLSAAECLAEARRYGERAQARAGTRFTQWAVPAAGAALRVGLVSGDLRAHPVGYFLDGLFAHLDAARIELFAYPTQPGGDALTERLRAHCVGWHPVYGLADAAAAEMIHAHGVQVLVDLAGHTAHNRLPVFAFKPAPVQVTWLGYFATTGLAEIDYLLADAVSVPAAHHGHFSEAIWTLPETRLCFTPPEQAPAVAPLPALDRGFVTFGSFQNLAKINDAVLALWARVLAAMPGARLRLQDKQLADASMRAQLGARLQQAGIAIERVLMHGPQPRPAYLAAHAEVDLLLDTFPFPGGTTTCEALVMGVPTVTLAGDRLIGRQGASLLTAAGLADWIAHTPEEFVRIAVARAADLQALAQLRSTLRDKVLASPLFDAPRFAQHLTDALLAMAQHRAHGLQHGSPDRK